MRAVDRRILAVATRELGVTEKPPGSNRGERISEYQEQDWIPGGGYPWCVSFAWGWVVWLKVLEKPNPYPTASVAQLEKWARANGWSAGVSSIRPGDLACLNGGQHVTIVHHLLPGGSRFVGLGGNQSDQVRLSDYSRTSITTLIRVPGGKLPKIEPAKPPRFEVVRGEGERRKVVYLGARPGKAAQVVANLIKKGVRVITVRRR